MSIFQTYLYPCIFIFNCALLSLINSLQIPVPVCVPDYETYDYDTMDSNNGSTLIPTLMVLPRPLDYGKFNFKATYRGSQMTIIGQILEYPNGTKEFSLSGHYQVVIISNSFGTQSGRKFNIFHEFDFGLCPPSNIRGISHKAVQSIIG